MNKLTAMFFLLFCAGTVSPTKAQTSVNSISLSAEIFSPRFIEGISFTPEGISQVTANDKRKSAKAAVSPVASNEGAGSNNLAGNSIERFSGIQFKYAMLLNIDVEELKNIPLFTFIENWIGTRYKLGGTTKRGIDCSALTGSLLMAVYGFAVPRTAREQYKATRRLKEEELKEGDLVFFNTRGGVSHVGLYLENDYFVHSSFSQGVTISNLQDEYYAKRFICGGRVEEE